MTQAEYIWSNAERIIDDAVLELASYCDLTTEDAWQIAAKAVTAGRLKVFADFVEQRAMRGE